MAEDNGAVVRQELEAQGIDIPLRTIPRAVADLRREDRAAKLATTRFETKPGQ